MIEVVAFAAGLLVGVLVTAWSAIGQYDKGWHDATREHNL
jgi:hypothetical protein